MNDQEKRLAKLEDSWSDFAFFLRTDMRLLRRGKLSESMVLHSLLDDLQILEVFRKRLAHQRTRSTAKTNSSSNYSVLLALEYCGKKNLPIPCGLADELARALKVFNSKAGPHSLDQVF